MAIIVCKRCGGDLNFREGSSTAECEFCGSVQTVPRVDDEKKLNLFARANRLRAACDFDKAAGIYESIVADFPEEAEAYWGLVLCKYGIEYVDDPATGKKIPTCHRSSYDSVLTDDNFEQAMENADVMAQRLYREEAKELERIRKGILEVSSAEQPYDIFICYKETDANGDRTLDSVLAQDLYSALTDKGYRVFFSRITLRNKLGMDYEPAIFAALNSAKVMLAVGTCYEYYNAVWVKNEWSRYLKICAADKSKHLIPCYRDLDPEDMPREFNHLQGADLSKMGAIQDIIFNMEKYIPLQKQTVATTTVIQQVAATNTTPLLKRGNMALEDREWINAENFFEEVLNQEAECAEAYLGKALAQAKCSNLKAYVQAELAKVPKKMPATQIPLPENRKRIQEAVDEHVLPGFLEEAEIRNTYAYDLNVDSFVMGWKRAKQDLMNRWHENRNLSRAVQFATGATAASLKDALNQLTSQADAWIQQAEQERDESTKNRMEQYQRFLDQADAEVRRKKEAAIEAREAAYQRMIRVVTESNDRRKLENARRDLEKLNGYRNSAEMISICDEKLQVIYKQEEIVRLEKEEAARVAEEKARVIRERQDKITQRNYKQAALLEQQALLEKLQKDQKKLNTYRRLCVVAIVLAVLFIAAPLLYTAEIIPESVGVAVFGVSFFGMIVVFIYAAILWLPLWPRYAKHYPGNFLQKLFATKRVKFLKNYLEGAIADTKNEIKKIRDELDA